ncbi:hypothetical protein FGO68_gene5792 [Halteria grandinella]|uniref:Uncharacterized protein n=1 Tax=Halteria grandinella TaxID=5974 RepID=A0A8J8NWX3_HALGN|nr:hypothetical protein FGO68_gene5792 [Halteria grandinella]
MQVSMYSQHAQLNLKVAFLATSSSAWNCYSFDFLISSSNFASYYSRSYYYSMRCIQILNSFHYFYAFSLNLAETSSVELMTSFFKSLSISLIGLTFQSNIFSFARHLQQQKLPSLSEYNFTLYFG